MLDSAQVVEGQEAQASAKIRLVSDVSALRRRGSSPSAVGAASPARAVLAYGCVVTEEVPAGDVAMPGLALAARRLPAGDASWTRCIHLAAAPPSPSQPSFSRACLSVASAQSSRGLVPHACSGMAKTHGAR